MITGTRKKKFVAEITARTHKIISGLDEKLGGADSVIIREVSFSGDLSAVERVKLSEIVEKCPIHRLLVSNIKIETHNQGPIIKKSLYHKKILPFYQKGLVLIP